MKSTRAWIEVVDEISLKWSSFAVSSKNCREREKGEYLCRYQ